jgi:hypothetical protein
MKSYFTFSFVIPFIGITVKIESDDKDCDDDNGILTNEEAVDDQELEGKSAHEPLCHLFLLFLDHEELLHIFLLIPDHEQPCHIFLLIPEQELPFIGITVKIESDDKDCDDDNGILTNEEAVHDQELEGKSEVVLHDQELEGKCDVYVPDQELGGKCDREVPAQELEGKCDMAVHVQKSKPASKSELMFVKT